MWKYQPVNIKEIPAGIATGLQACGPVRPEAPPGAGQDTGLLGQSGFAVVSVPFVDDKAELFQVAFIVKLQGTGRGVEAVAADGFGNLVGVSGVGDLHGISHYLYSSVGRENERTARVLALILERLGQGGQHAFGGSAGDGSDVGVANTFRAHELGRETVFGRLAQQGAHLRVVAAKVDELNVFTLHLGDQGREVLVAGSDTFKQHYRDFGLVQRGFDRSGNPFAILLLVMQNRSTGRFELLNHILAGSRALHVVQADGAENEGVALFGQFRRGGCGGDHQDAFFLIDIGSRLAGAGAQVTDNKLDAVVDDLVGYGNRLLGVARIIIGNGFEHAAIDAAALVDLLDGHVGAH